MQVFSAYFRIVKRLLPQLMIYVCVFMGLAIVFTFMNGGQCRDDLYRHVHEGSGGGARCALAPGRWAQGVACHPPYAGGFARRSAAVAGCPVLPRCAIHHHRP